ncbi:preprotein translocase subunit SecA [Fulvivirga sp. M361]|uniref:preprotein translocase subunit SecA n=1 Tax=Fulvivirga sp. M361 TaxID=2594266 RepID=UPI00117AF906|nr:preprotein translocase subunit SecA [Fulvivirga sp. M361]TRX61234.1 preprotein translocase subunit SecA [Fulvivirga sp. M361]
MLKFITKVLGTKSDKDIKKMMPVVEQINAEYAQMSSLSNDEVRGKTQSVIDTINEALRSIDEQIEALHQKVADNPDLDINEKELAFSQIDKLEEDRNEELEKVLKKVLPVTFAIVKETARRFKENEKVVVTATMQDKIFAAEKSHVELDGEQAIWHNKWEAAGNEITWEMLHYDVQLIGGMVLHNGIIAEMATGEGKTLVATLPAFLNALAKRGVHIVTVNNYLATRDSEWMAPIFEFHGLKVDCIDKYEPNSDERRKAYMADVTYGTNNEFGFDYLRDNMARDPEELVQRKHHYAMVDEVDSVLIDEARTPLIISGPIPKGGDHEFYDLKPRIAKLVEAQKKIVQQYLVEAKKLFGEGDEKEGGLPLFRAYRGLPKHKPLIKFLSETGIRQSLQKTENFYLQDNQKMMPEADEPLFFTIDEKQNSIELTEKGIDLITGEGEDPNFFIMPDIGMEIASLEKDEGLSDEEKLKKKDELTRDYSVKSQRIHSVNQLLKAYTLFEKDTEYILVDSKVKIVDEQTGRVMEGRRYSDGLHQAIEAKENVKVEDATQTYATITLQNYFRMYHKLAGMTGTAETEAGEFWEIYKLDVITIPTNRPIARNDDQDMVYKTMREKFNAVVEEIVKLTGAGQPVLVGTTSVEISELLSRMLNIRKIKHQVLNAKQHQREAEVVSEAGKPGTVTIATNMAGRGTDIKLTKESKDAGGLAIIGTERHESRRVDRQLRGRSGRQGDPGSSQFFVSLEDNLMRMFMPERISKIMDRLGLQEGEVISHSMVTKSIERAQKKVEENNFGTRKRLLEYDDVMNSQREVIYKRRRNALYGERLQLDIMNMLFDTCEDIVANTKGLDNFESFKLTTLGVLGMDYEIDKSGFEAISEQELSVKLYEEALAHYGRKNKDIAQKSFPIIKDIEETRGATIENILVPFTDGKRQMGVSANLKKCVASENDELIVAMEKMVTLGFIDKLWKDHLREMDDLKQSVQNAVYEQKDPLLIYKFEGFELFKRFIAKVNEETISFLMKSFLPVQESQEVQEARSRRRQKLQEKKDESRSLLSGGSPQTNRPPAEKTMPVKSDKIFGRNDRVTVQYMDGTLKKDVKFKIVEEDIKSNKCVMVED